MKEHNCSLSLIKYLFKLPHFFFRYAHSISVGDEVIVHENYEVMPAKVINVSKPKMEGECYLFFIFLKL